MSVVSPWFVLGIPEGSPPSVVRAAWRAKVREFHPDGNGHGDVDRFLAAKAAYAQLRDPAVALAPTSDDGEPTVAGPASSPCVVDQAPVTPMPPPTGASSPPSVVADTQIEADIEAVFLGDTTAPVDAAPPVEMSNGAHNSARRRTIRRRPGASNSDDLQPAMLGAVVALVTFIAARVISVMFSPILVDLPSIAVSAGAVAAAAVGAVIGGRPSARKQLPLAAAATVGAAFGAWELALAALAPLVAVAASIHAFYTNHVDQENKS